MLAVVEAAATDQPLDIGCVDTALARRCFTLYTAHWTWWSEAASRCVEKNGSRLAAVDQADVERKLSGALMTLNGQSQDDSGRYMAWTAGRELYRQREWNWINGHSLQRQSTMNDNLLLKLILNETVLLLLYVLKLYDD